MRTYRSLSARAVGLVIGLAWLCAGLTAAAHAAAVELRIASWFPADSPDALATEAIRKFEASHPGVTVKWETIDWGTYWSKIPVEVAAGVAPDLLTVTYAEQDASWIQQGMFLPLDSFVRGASGLPLNDFDAPVLRAGMMDGRLYYIPVRINVLTWIYNQDLIDQAGLQTPRAGWTWDDLLNITRKLTRRDGGGKVQVYGTRVDTWPLMSYTFIYGGGGRLFDDENTLLPGKAVYNSPEALSGLRFYFDLVTTQGVAPAPNVAGGYVFEKGQLGMIQTGNWFLSRLPQLAPGVRFGGAIAPVGKVPFVAQGGGTGYGISRASKHPELAWELLKALIDRDVLVQIGATDSAIITRRSARSELANKNLWANRLWQQAAPYFRPAPVVGFEEVLVKPLGAAIGRAISGEVPYKAAIDEAVRQSNLALAKWRETK